MDYTKELEYYYSWEFATRSPEVLNDSNLDQVEVYDCHEKQSIDISEKTVDQLARILADIAANWRKISEEEFNKITNS